MHALLSAAKFLGWSLLAILVLHIVAVLLFLPAANRWGSTKAEQKMALAGDELMEPVLATRAITIDAAPEQIYPWLAQMGSGRGGMYSYTWLENLFGCKMVDADRIYPEWQVKVGDDVVLHPAGLKMPVTALEPGRTLILAEGSWSFHLVPQEDGSTRLIARSRGSSGGTPAWANRFLVMPIAFLMEQKMLRTLRDRAEGAA